MVITLQSRLSKIDIKGGVDMIYRSHVFTHVKNLLVEFRRGRERKAEDEN